MNAPSPFEYAVLRAVPRVQRGECCNIGVLLHAQRHGALLAGLHVDEDRLLALDPQVDLAGVRAAAQGYVTACTASDGPVGPLRIGERFRWLTAPRSTVVQPGPVHGGMTSDPAAELEHLLDVLVR